MTLAPGARLGPYEVLGLVGVGGMGDASRAPGSPAWGVKPRSRITIPRGSTAGPVKPSRVPFGGSSRRQGGPGPRDEGREGEDRQRARLDLVPHRGPQADCLA